MEMKIILGSVIFFASFSLCYSATGTLSFNTTYIEVDERDYGKVPLNILRSGGSDGAIDFQCEILNSTGDFQSNVVLKTIQTGETSSSCQFLVRDDAIPEGNETFVVQLSLKSGNGTLNPPTLSYINILANDDAYGVIGFDMANDAIFHEPRTAGSAAKGLPVQRQIGTYGSISVSWRVTEPPTASKDITPISGLINFQSGEASTDLNFFVHNDTETEDDEDFTFELTSVSGGARLNSSLSKVVVRISANDIPVRFALKHIAVPENQSSVVVWIYRGLDPSGTNQITSVDLTSSASWYLRSDGATGNQDFNQSNGTIVFTLGETKKSVNITIIDDDDPELSENFTVHLTSLSPDVTLVSPSVCTIQILQSDDHTGVFGFPENGTVIVSEDGQSNLVKLTVERTAGNFGLVVVTWRATSAVSSLPEQISPTNGTAVFNDGTRYHVINITIKQDVLPEEAFSFVVELIEVSNGRLVDDPFRRTKEVIVQDSDDVYGVFEFAHNFHQKLSLTTFPRMIHFVISRNGGKFGTVSVGYEIKYLLFGGADHTSTVNISSSGLVTMVSGQQNASVHGTISQKGFLQANSVFKILLTSLDLTKPAKTLVAPVTPRFGARRILNLTVHPQFADGEIGFEKTTISVKEPEGDQAMEVKIKVLRDGTFHKTSLLWSIAGVKTSNDLKPTSGSVTFEKGADTFNITVYILPDATPELDENFTIQLHNVSEPNQRLQPGSSELVLTIENNDNAGGIFQFDNVRSIILSENSQSKFSVDVVRLEGDLDERFVKIEATNGKDDFTPYESFLIFVKGQRRITSTFYVKDDNIPETNKTINFRLLPSGPAANRGSLGNFTHFIVTILANDDPNGVIVFLNNSLSIDESKNSQKFARFFVGRRRGLFGHVAVSWNITPEVNATLDVSPTSGRLEFRPQEQIKILEVFSIADNVPELDENFTLTLTGAEGDARIGNPGKALITILRNDDAIEFAQPAHVRVSEGQRAGFTILRKGRHQESVTVNYTTRDGSATTADLDYVPVSRQVVFASGDTRKDIFVSIPDDDQPESDENFTITLTSSTGDTAIYGNTVAVVTIAASDDPNGIFHFDGNSVLNKTASEQTTVSFSVVRDRGIFGTVAVLWQIYQVFPNGSHLKLTSGDFEQTSGALVFEDRVKEKKLEIKVLSDDLAEYQENFEVVLINTTGGHPGPGGEISKNLKVAYIRIPTNDNPYGLFAFSAKSLDIKVAEDTRPGLEYEAIANLTVLRKRGRDRDVGVSWCIYKTEGAANLGDIWDLVFLSNVVGRGVVENLNTKRPNTGTKALEFSGSSDSYAMVNSLNKVPAKGFTISVWIRPKPGNKGAILAKTTALGTSYELILDARTNITLHVKVMVSQDRTLSAFADIGNHVIDNSWHNIMVTIDSETGVLFYCDGDRVGTNSSVRFQEILDDQGDLYLGVSSRNVSRFEGMLQDVKIFTKALQESEVKNIAKPVSDVKPINGYLNFTESVASRTVAITTVDNSLTEGEKVFSVILVSSRGGADVADAKSSRARLTVLKSDNANGLFAFSPGQMLSRSVPESQRNISLKVQRTLGIRGQVTVAWEITNVNGLSASDDFVQASGFLVFLDGDVNKMLSVSVNNDRKPELVERFTLRLVSAKSDDGKQESTATSGASINEVSSECNITILENDSPYGLLQFSSTPPVNGTIVPLTDAFRMDVRESFGTFKLYIVRAQGVLGDIKCSWKTVKITAVAGVDYTDNAGTVTFRNGETSVPIDIQLIDNNKPELNKTLHVELYGPRNGAEVGAGGVAVIVILPSDDAFGVINFTSSSLSKVVREGQRVTLELQRTGGALGAITIYWNVDSYGDELVKSSGQVTMDTGQRSALLSVDVKDDLRPELSESLLVRLTNASSGRLSSTGIVANVTVVANDDPYGVFEFQPAFLSVMETNTNITLHIVRRNGTMGKTRVYFTSVPSSILVNDEMYDRATEDKDYLPLSGHVDFLPNQTYENITLTIIDDVLPEDNETILVNLTSVLLISDVNVPPEAVRSPRIGAKRLAQVVILRNDNASGVVRLSSSVVTTTEGFDRTFLSVVRTGGTFGEVTVSIEVSPSSAQPNLDYKVNFSTVTIADGERTTAVPISIINDDDPEFNETFTVRLLSNGPHGYVHVGSPSQCLVTIQENDYPYGLIGFSASSLNKFVSEPSSGNQVVSLDVIREYGTLGVVRFRWQVTLHGRLAATDVLSTEGETIIPPGENKTAFSIVILADNIPEINEVLSVTLNVTGGKAVLNPERRQANVTIQVNDEAYGVVEFSQESYTVREKDQNATAHIPIVRNRGSYGNLRVYYSTVASTSPNASIPYQDYIPITNASVTIPNGIKNSAVCVTILGDNIPELGKYLTIVLERVELMNSSSFSKPSIGLQSSISVTIQDDDHVYGLFKIFADKNRSQIVVNETEGLAVNLEVHRYGGATGDVTVAAVISPESTARENSDFKGSGSTFTFKNGERQKSLTLSINGDDIPEPDETIIVKLVNPTEGASVADGTGNNVTVVIQANDVVAGRLGFSRFSQAVVVKEGQVIALDVTRRPSAVGSVTVDWVIRGYNVTEDFNQTSGTVEFKEGQNVSCIRTLVLADNTSEVDEQFQVILRNPVTSGVSRTGAAEIDSRMGSATVTIAASNEPHGVVEFQQSSRIVTVTESERVVRLSVARLFGNIGKICLHFVVFNGSLQHLAWNQRLAIPSEDTAVDNTSIVINSGVSIGEILISIVDDNLAELDEFFLVNITAVELIHSQPVNNDTFAPPRLGQHLTSEVKIQENDGPNGIMVFSPSRVNVSEEIGVFNLTVLRTQGTFGDIEVSYFIRKVSISEKDFSVYGNLNIGGEKTLKFVAGKRTQNITVFICDDNIPEGDEVFAVYLTKPKGGAQLGQDKIAYVTVLVSDAGNGIFKFDSSSLNMFVDEPGNSHVGTTKATFTIFRENGTIGGVIIGWSIVNESASMDFKFVNGTVTFRDGERRRSFEVETVVDLIPEKKERFLVVLEVLAGGGELKSPSQAWLTVSENDEPYGEFGFAVFPNTLNIEETVGAAELKVLRNKGTYGRVTVNYECTPKTADGTSGSIIKFGIFQTFRTQHAQCWHAFLAYGTQYLMLGTKNSSTGGNHSSVDAYLGSSLFRWQGVYTHVMGVKTNNPVHWESFTIEGQVYVAVANHGSEKHYEVNSSIYKLYQNDTMELYQNIPTQAASGVKFFKPSGSSSSFLIFTNMQDNSGSTAILSKLYKWHNGRFIQDGSGLNCRGASGLVLFTINSRQMLSIASFYDSVNKNFQSKSVIFEWKNQAFQAVQEILTNGATGVEYFEINDEHFLVFANSKSPPFLYKWDSTMFRLYQNLPVVNAKGVEEFTMNGEVFLALTFLGGNSQLLKWENHVSNFSFYTSITDSDVVHVQPITLQDPVAHNVTVLAVAMAGKTESHLLQRALMSGQADFIPRQGQLIFEDGDTELSIYVPVLVNNISEPDESFVVSLSNATGGSIVGPGKDLEVNILSNGNPYGRVGFSPSSLSIMVDEGTRDSKLYLDVLREQGMTGVVIVVWNSTGNASSIGRNGYDEVSPTSGEVVFLQGETRRTINLTILADNIPEVNEVLFVRLASLTKKGTDSPNKGATINSASDTATVVIKANDEPHGIVGWQRTVVLAQESEATNSSVQLVLERRRGTIGDIKISFCTVQATSTSSRNAKPAVPYQDFIPVASQIIMTDGVNITTLNISVIHDDNAEMNEIFYVNITNVRLLSSYSSSSINSPRINPSSRTAKVIISENDNERGELNFNTSHLVDPRTGILKVNEDVGRLSLEVVRTGGTFGKIGFEYRLVPDSINNNDYLPTKGQIIFLTNETSHYLEINITDDKEAEVGERFRVEMTQPIGGAKLGSKREVLVEIRASDQPYGVFEFSEPSIIVMEEGREIRLTVARLQGSFREVHVLWNLSVGAFPDVYPANGTLIFDDNVTSQVIRLSARDDSIPEGDKMYLCHLVSADNGGVLGSVTSVRLRIDANDDGYGVMAVDPTTSLVFVGEPELPFYDGQVMISVVRNAGTYGEVLVDWELTSDDQVFGKAAETFNLTQGTIVFADNVKVRNVSLQVKQDSYPEESGNFTFRLTGTRDARIDQPASRATVVVVASDNPYGIIEFMGPLSYNVSENSGQLILSVVRHKGHIGRLLVTINVVANGATEGKDFEVLPKVLTIDDKQDRGSINVSIFADGVPELLESFNVNLSSIQLITSKHLNYGYVNDLQIDMPPKVGKRYSIEIRIKENDDPHGVVEFKESRMIVHEHDTNVLVSVIRSGGTFGKIQARYSATNITAEYGQDFLLSAGIVTFDNGQHMVNLSIPLVDDDLPEDRESFRLDLVSVDGDARLGDQKSVVIVLETSDNPDGLFGFVNKTRFVFNNPNTTKVLNLAVSRIGGARSRVQVQIQVFKTFPSPAKVTDDVTPDKEDLTFSVNEFGPKIFELSVIPFIDRREVEEHFVVSITEVSGNASIDSLKSNVTVVILKHGMPNGLFGFASPFSQTVSEDGGPVVLTVLRREGREGSVEVKWLVSGSAGVANDFVKSAGSVIFFNGEERKQISLTVSDDDVPELTEIFIVTLVSASGGGDIDPRSSNATITIRANDNPHGRFRLRSNAQHITVEDDLSRSLSFTVERVDGRFGDVRVDYTLEYSKSYPRSLNGHVVIRDGEGEKVQSLVLDDSAFLFPGSHFSLKLTGVSYQRSGASDIAPTLIFASSREDIKVADKAANSVLKIKDGSTTLLVNQDNQVPRVVVSRDGLYGNVTVFLTSGFPDGKFPGFSKGSVKPSVLSLTFSGNDKEKEFSVQVSPILSPREKMVFAVYLSRVTSPSNVRGGSRIDTAGQTAVVEPGGVVVVAMESQNIAVIENVTARLSVYRIFSCLGTVLVNYTTIRSSTALPGQDYKAISTRFSMKGGQFKREIDIHVINDDIPELDETFMVKITDVTGENTRLGANTTSTISIQDDDSPYGILSFATSSVTVFENTTFVNIIVSRSGGTFGDVGVLVRTVGGGESWNMSDKSEINDILSKRDPSKKAIINEDYYPVNTRVTFNNEKPRPLHGQNQTVQLRLIDDSSPEIDEEIYLYLSDPTGQATLANPEAGGQSWAMVTIEGNDLMNGNIGFKETSLTINEDKNPKGEIEVTRTSSLGAAKVKWQVFGAKENLMESTGIVEFAPGVSSVNLVIQLKEDTDPELESDFTVKLVSVVDTREASIDQANNVVKISVKASDDPFGLIGFGQDSRNIAVDVSKEEIMLSVVRRQGTNSRVTVSYKTEMLPERYTDNDLVINRAIESKDYRTTNGILEFAAGKSEPNSDLKIILTPNSASSSPYPKAFNVTLFNETGGSRLNDRSFTTMVIISNKRPTTEFLKLRSSSLKTPLSNSDMARVLQELISLIKRPPLAENHISIVVDVLNTILDDNEGRDEEKQKILTDEVTNLLIDVFDILLNPEREDFRGKSQLTEPFVKYAFALIHGEPCPGTSVVTKNGKYATVEGRRRQEKDINSLIIKSSAGKNSFTYPSNMYDASITSSTSTVKCEDIHFIEYQTAHWFNEDNINDILNDRVLSTSLKNMSGTNPRKGASLYRIYAGERRVTPKGAECLKWREGAWDNSICSLKQESDDYVECECTHFSNFAVRGQSDDRVGYEFYFYVAAFVCMISFFLVLLSHHTCSIENTFSAKLLMHLFFAGFVLHLLVIVAAYVSPGLSDKPNQCAALGILIHYFLLAHFSWIFVQSCNLWRILVLNDEQTHRKFILYFMLGWGLPVVFVALYVIVTHALYSWGITDIYADVHNNGDMCFIRNAYGALASVLAPVLLFLLGVCVVATQAYQVTLQWKLYDDIFRGHHNIKEVVHLWIVFLGITLTWLFAGLHLAFGKLWLAIVFAVFQLCTGLYVFMVYFILRNQCRRKYRSNDYLLNASSPSMLNGSPNDYYAERPVMYDAQSMQSLAKSDLRITPPNGNEWDEFDYDGTTPKGSRRVMNDAPQAQTNPLYNEYHGNKQTEANEDVDEEEELSQDFNNLIFALKTGETWEDEKKEDIVELNDDPMRTDKLELRRISIADTHV